MSLRVSTSSALMPTCSGAMYSGVPTAVPKAVLARFEAERQALAIMDHPHIAQVHDGGATTSGRPYFVMELVRGVPITDFCDQNHLGVRERYGTRSLPATFIRRAAVEDPGDVGVVHQGQSLPLGLEAGEDGAGVHAEFDQLEGD